MASVHANKEFDELLTAAFQQSVPAYIEAVAATIEGSPTEAWRDFEIVTARAILLSYLVGIAQTFEEAEVAADQFEPDKVAYAKVDWPLEVGFDEFRVEPFEEAIRLFDERIPMLASNVPKLAQIAKAQAVEIAMAEKLGVVAKLDAQTNAISQALGTAFWVSDVDQATTISLKDLISQAVRGVLPDERLSLPDFIDRAWLAGAQNLTASRLETVYRTNMQSAYNEGHMSTMRAPEVKKVAPLVMIVEIDDDRSRDHHAAMDGYINFVEYIDQLQLRPPNGYNCRGTVRAVSWTEAKRLGLVDNDQVDSEALKRYNGDRQGYIDRGEYPDPGFSKVYRAA